MNPPESPATQKHYERGETPSGEIVGVSIQAASSKESEITGPGLHEARAGDLGNQKNERKIEDASKEPVQGCSNDCFEQVSRKVPGPTPDVEAAPRSAIGHLGEIRAVSRLLAGGQEKDQELLTLGLSAYERFQRTDDVDDINRAIEYWGIGVTLPLSTHTVRLALLGNLGIAYGTRFERLGEMSDLNEAIAWASQAVSLTPDGHPKKPGKLNNLGAIHRSRFERLGDISDLNEAIARGAQAVSLTSDGHPDRPAALSNLGLAYRTRFRRLGEVSDLNKAISSGSRAVSLTPEGHPLKPAYLNNLVLAYRIRYHRLGEVTDLNEAIVSGSKAILLTPDRHPLKSAYLNNLGSTYSIRFAHLGEVSDLNEAIASGARSVSLTPDGHPDKPGRLTDLGVAFGRRFQRFDEISDLNEAISLESQAVSLTPDGHPDKPGRLSNLGVTYAIRFGRLGEMSDLNNAIKSGSQAVSLTPEGHPDKPARLNNLGLAYRTRFGRLDEISDLNEAIACGLLAVSLALDGHLDKPGTLSSLGVAYRTRFERLGNKSDLNEAIASGSLAVSLTPDGHPDKPGRLSNLGNAYTTRFKYFGDVSDLNEAITSGSQAVLLALDDHPDKPGMLSNLGIAYITRFQCLENTSDLKSAVSVVANAAQSPIGPPLTRFWACRRWAELSLLDTESSPRLAYQQAMELLPLLVWIGTTLERRYELIAEVGDLAAEAASYAISSNALGLALEWLEAGRSIIWAQMARLRTPFDQVASHDPELAKKLQDVSCRLEQAGSRASPFLTAPNDYELVHEANSHVNLALNWDKLLTEARSLPGFEGFLRPPKASDLMRAAQSHPIALINCHELSCDALILQPNTGTISHVPLRDFSYEIGSTARGNLNLLARQGGFQKVGHSLLSANKPSQLEETLKHLWFGIVNPILDHLGFTNKVPIDQLPRITWCTTGILSFLPLHAAGCYDICGSSTFDYVISSYTPTLSALLTSQSRSSVDHCGLVAIGQEHTRGFSPLPCINNELKAIKEHAQECLYLQLESDEATTDQVLDAMEQFSWVHMACHGTQNIADPTQSAFHLHDGPLTLAKIASRSFTNKGLAFLSACQTATGDEKLPDEAIHLAAGMMMAGFPSVIGTMWSIADEDGPKVADKVYAELLKDGRMDHTKAARALHQAVASLRTQVGEKAIERWAPFIHIGS